MNLSDFLEAALLDHTFRGTAYTAPGTIYVALSTADPTENGSGLAEPSGAGYARLGIATGSAQWTRSGNTVTNVNDHSFAQATGAWGTLTHWALFDAATGGNMLAHGQLPDSKSPVDGDTPTIKAGDISVTLNYSTYLNGVLLDHVFGIATYTAAGTLYVALSTTDPGSDGATASEPADGYARQSVEASTAGFDRTDSEVSNAAKVAFPTATGSWGTISHFMVLDASTGGNMLLGDAVTTAKAIDTDDTAKFAAGALKTTLD